MRPGSRLGRPRRLTSERPKGGQVRRTTTGSLLPTHRKGLLHFLKNHLRMKLPSLQMMTLQMYQVWILMKMKMYSTSPTHNSTINNSEKQNGKWHGNHSGWIWAIYTLFGWKEQLRKEWLGLCGEQKLCAHYIWLCLLKPLTNCNAAITYIRAMQLTCPSPNLFAADHSPSFLCTPSHNEETWKRGRMVS